MQIARFHSTIAYEGVSLEIFISGCKHNCKGCHNGKLWNFDFGQEMSLGDILLEIKERINWIDSIILTGGDPLWSAKETLELVRAIKKTFPMLKRWLYTGFTKEEIDKDGTKTKIFELCDVVITDRYDESLPSTKLTGSRNQRIWRNRKIHTSV